MLAASSLDVTIDNGPAWVQILIAIGTLAAAAFAGWAAFAAAKSAKETRDLVAVELGRDARQAEEALWHYVRRLSVELRVGPVDASGVSAVDVILDVVDEGSAPMFNTRFKVELGGATWGPGLVGTLRPGIPVRLTARIYNPGTDQSVWNAYVRTLDVNGNYWVIDAKGERKLDPDETQRWIDDGRAFAQRQLSVEERGTLTGVNAVVP